MDKRQVIAAYRRGIITIHECAQILGLDTRHISSLVNEPRVAVEQQLLSGRRSVNR